MKNTIDEEELNQKLANKLALGELFFKWRDFSPLSSFFLLVNPMSFQQA